MEKTAVQWLIDNLEKFEACKDISWRCYVEIHEALRMEKEQIRSAYIDAQDDIIEQSKFKPEHHLNSLHYYQKKYESS